MPVARSGCEPCRLRKVKCDYSSSSSTCSNCTKRNLSCPGPCQPPMDSRRKRRGRVIDKMEQEYGISSKSPRSRVSSASSSSSPANASSGTLPCDTNASTSTKHLPIVHTDLTVASPAEKKLWEIELRSEVALSMLQSFMISHGHLWLALYPDEMVSRAFDLARHPQVLAPEVEVATRVFLALGARTTLHPSVLGGADMSSPLTLGIVREGPCRHLAMVAVERFETLGLWRQPTAEVIKVAVSVVLIARSAFSPEYCRPLVSMLVHLLRQFLGDSTLPPDQLAPFIAEFGSLILLTDARSAAELGTRPLCSREDLEDNPMLEDWLSRPMDESRSFGRPDGLFASTVRLLRSLAVDFHLPLRRRSQNCLKALPRLWETQSILARHVASHMEKCAVHHLVARMDGVEPAPSWSSPPIKTKSAEATKGMVVAMQINATLIFVNMLIYHALGQVVSSETMRWEADADIWRASYAAAEAKAKLELKRVAAHVKVVQQVSEGQEAWQHMTRLFYAFQSTPGWTSLLAPDPLGTVHLTEEEIELIINGVQQSGWGWGEGATMWLAAVIAKG